MGSNQRPAVPKADYRQLPYLEHDGLELNRYAVSASTNDLVSRTRRSPQKRVHVRLRHALGGAPQGLDTKNAKTTPCKVEWAPARSARAAPRPEQEKKNGPSSRPNLISSRSNAREIWISETRPAAAIHELSIALSCARGTSSARRDPVRNRCAARASWCPACRPKVRPRTVWKPSPASRRCRGA
jgi:hypothetical protein